MKKLLIYLLNKFGTQDDSPCTNNDVGNWLVKYLVYLYRACDKNEEFFRNMIEGNEKNRAYIFRPNTLEGVFWKTNLITLGSHNIRCYDPINHEHVSAGRFYCMNLQPSPSGRVFLKESDDLKISGLKQSEILYYLNKKKAVTYSTSGGGDMMDKSFSKKQFTDFKEEVLQTFSNSTKNIIDSFMSSAIVDKTFVPFDYTFAKPIYVKVTGKKAAEQLMKEYEKRNVDSEQVKIFFHRNERNKDKALLPAQGLFQFWCRLIFVKLVQEFYSNFEKSNLSSESFLSECGIKNYGIYAGNQYSKEDLSFALMSKFLKNGAMWNYVKTVKPKFVLFLLWCIKDAGAAHWKMKDSNFGTYVNDDQSFISKVNHNFSDDFMYKDDIPFFPYSPEDDFEQLGIPLLRDVLYNTRIGTLNKNKVEFDNGVNGILVRFLQEKKRKIENKKKLDLYS